MSFEQSKFEKQPAPEDKKEKTEIKTEELPQEKETKKVGEVSVEGEKEFSPEIQGKAEEFDKRLVEIIGKQVGSKELTPEQANEILERAKELNPEQKAKMLEELEKEISPEEIKEKEEAREKFQETISQYEEAIDNLVEKANNLGIEISAEQLRAYLENLRNIEPEAGEEMEWLKELNENIKNLTEKMDALGKAKEAKQLKPEDEEKAKEDITKLFEEFTAKTLELIIKLTIRITQGIIKGIFRAFRKESI